MSATQEELILRMMPFSPSAKKWFLDQPELAEALKILNTDRFIALGAVSITRSPLRPSDEVIGFFVYDYRQRQGVVKQDFIVNLGGRNEEFVLYTKLPVPKYGKYVKPIREFEIVYGGDGLYYTDTHHPKPETLDPLIAKRIPRAKKIATKRLAFGRPVIKSQTELDDIDSALKQLGQ